MSSGGAAPSSAQVAHDAQLAYLLGRRDLQAPELAGAFSAQFRFSSTDEMPEAYTDCIQELLGHPNPVFRRGCGRSQSICMYIYCFDVLTLNFDCLIDCAKCV